MATSNDTYRFLSVVMLFVVALSMPQTVAAQSANNNAPSYTISQVAVMDLDRVLRQSEAMMRVRALLDEKRQEFQSEFAARERSLLAKERELKEKRASLSDAEYRQNVAIFQSEVSDVQQQIQARRQSLDQAFRAAQEQIRTMAVELVTEYSLEQGIDIVLKRDSVFIFRNQLDITDAVSAKLNSITAELVFELDETTNGPRPE